nr:ileal sodium/bile acid cotransporter-like [Lytechinus pictus]
MSWTSPPTMFASNDIETTDFGSMNSTDYYDDVTPFSEAVYLVVLKTVQKWLMTFILVCIMVAMGAVITLNDFKETFRHPVGFIIGFVSQFVTMPLICFLTALILDLEPPFALGLLIIGCCPGGTVSNLFTFWADGDVCLSVCMTTVSCVAAIGMMPLNLLIYSRRWTTESTRVPFMNIFTTLVTIIVPATVGIIIRIFSLKWANIVSKIGGVAGLAGIPIAIVLIGIINPGMFASSWKIWTSTLFLPFFGYFFGHGVARIFRQPSKKCRTIGFETGVQNAALGITIMLLTFGNTPLLYDMLTIPSFYGILAFCDFLIYVAIYRLYYYNRPNQPKKMEEEDGEEGNKDCHQGNGIHAPGKASSGYQPIQIIADTNGILSDDGQEVQHTQEKNDENMDSAEDKISINYGQ